MKQKIGKFSSNLTRKLPQQLATSINSQESFSPLKVEIFETGGQPQSKVSNKKRVLSSTVRYPTCTHPSTRTIQLKELTGCWKNFEVDLRTGRRGWRWDWTGLVRSLTRQPHLDPTPEKFSSCLLMENLQVEITMDSRYVHRSLFKFEQIVKPVVWVCQVVQQQTIDLHRFKSQFS